MLSAWRKSPTIVQDIVLGLFVGLIGVSPTLSYAYASSHGAGWSIAMSAIAAVVVRLRRTVPVIAFVAALAMAIVANWSTETGFASLLALGICAYSVLVHSRRIHPAVVATGLAATVAVGFAYSISQDGTEVAQVLTDYAPVAFLHCTILGLGIAMRREQHLSETLRERNVELETLRAAEAERAVNEERSRIARELHDLVAHHVSAMVITSRAGARAAKDLPQPVTSAFGTITQSGTEALDAMRGLVSMLRSADDEAELHPQPDLSEIPDLIAGFERVGLRVDAELHFPNGEVPAAIGLTAYRVVQEGLTNVLRHAGTRRAWVTLETNENTLIITIDDNGTASSTATSELPAGGHGLLGMRERIGLVDGKVDFGQSPQGGWRVQAMLPLPQSASSKLASVVSWPQVS